LYWGLKSHLVHNSLQRSRIRAYKSLCG